MKLRELILDDVNKLYNLLNSEYEYWFMKKSKTCKYIIIIQSILSCIIETHPDFEKDFQKDINIINLLQDINIRKLKKCFHSMKERNVIDKRNDAIRLFKNICYICKLNCIDIQNSICKK